MDQDLLNFRGVRAVLGLFGPVLAIAVHSLIGYNIYVYMIRLVLWRYFSPISAVSQLWTLFTGLMFSLICFMALWSYWRTYLTSPGSVPDDWSSTDPETGELRVTELGWDNRPRYCDKCKCYKPDRSHHCSLCQKCVLKMDHHCPWVNNCVGFKNHKFFILFVGYTALACLWYDLTIMYRFVEAMMETRGQDTMFLSSFIMVNAFLCTLGMFSSWHVFLAMKNSTTLEHDFSGMRPYDVGTKRNFEMVFGTNTKSWLLPIDPVLDVDGLVWPLSHTQYRRVNQKEPPATSGVDSSVEMGEQSSLATGIPDTNIEDL